MLNFLSSFFALFGVYKSPAFNPNLTTPDLNPNLLKNPYFTQGTGSVPVYWTRFGGGTFEWLDDSRCMTTKCVLVGGTSTTLVYQQVPGTAGSSYTLKGFALLGGGSGIGQLKLEFWNGNWQKLGEHKLPFTAAVKWTQFQITAGPSPFGTVYVNSNFVGVEGGVVLFDSVDLEVAPPDYDAFDLAKTKGFYGGLGAQVFAYGNTPQYPNLTAIRESALLDLNVKYVRVENYIETAPLKDLQQLRNFCAKNGINWLMTVWKSPTEFHTTADILKDVPGFADWWAEYVETLSTEGVEVDLIELMNEPNSKGKWSTGINTTQLSELVTLTRNHLDDKGFKSVGIVAPGLSTMTWTTPNAGGYINAFDKAAVSSISGWSTHVWADDQNMPVTQGGPNLDLAFLNFGPPANGQNANIHKFITEFATKQTKYGGVTYPDADCYGKYDPSKVFPYYSVTNTMPYAGRVFANFMSLLSSGSYTPFLWQTNDEPTEVFGKDKSWGSVDLWGRPKPVYYAIKLISESLPVGARAASPPNQNGKSLYAGVFVHGETFFVGIANDSEIDVKGGVVKLVNIPTGGFNVEMSRSFEQTVVGDVTIGQPDQGALFEKAIKIIYDAPSQAVLSTDLTAHGVMVVILQAKKASP